MSICEAIDACRLDSPNGPEISTGLSDVPFDVPNAPLWYANPKFSSFISQRGLAQDHPEARMDSSTSSVSVTDHLATCKTRRDVVAVVREAFAAQLRCDLRISMSDDDLMASRSNEIGLDSLVSVDLASWFRKKLQVGIPVLRIMSNESLEALVEHAAEQVPASLLPGLVQENGVENHERASGYEAKSMNTSKNGGFHGNGTVIDWEAEARPPPDIGFLLRSTSLLPGSVPAARPPRIIVLTGVTGLLGRHLLRHLLLHPAVQKVICLAVRNLPSRLASGELPISDSRVSYYEGGLSQPSLGLTPEQAASVFSEAESVIHNGADTSHMKTYAALKASNVGSTTALIALCLPRRVPIHFVSSAGLAVLYCSQDNGTAPNGQEKGFPDDQAVPVFPEVSVAGTPPTTEFVNFGYMCAKWVSERLLEHIVEDVEPRLRVSIHRPSTILREPGTRDTEEARSRLDWVNTLLQYVRDLKAIPKIENNIAGALDLVLVDSVCKGILREVFDDDIELSGGIRYVHEVGDIVVPLMSMDSSEYLLTTTGVDKVNGNVSGYDELTRTVKEPMKQPFDILPMQVWIKKATACGMHPAVAELIQAMDAAGASAYPRLHKTA
jgi:nucleoside-diphosphate-sugar epimerase/acyl carrier protein